MSLSGGCYCGAVRFEADGPIRMRGLCLCRTCQRISGGAGNLFVGLTADGFRYTQGEPRRFTRPDADDAPTREFCGDCGTHIAARSPRAPGGVIVKVGALDDPSAFEGPSIVVWTQEKQVFHRLPDGVPAFARFPSR
jgi:hypothetical protein